ncbi:FGGY family carbohydrate kinase [Porticoccus sp. GXU_MW_L64]
MYLVLDQGGQSSRAAVFAQGGELVELHQQPVSTHTPQSGWVEQNPAEILQSLRHCLAQVKDIEAIKSAALVTQRSSFVCWRRDNGNPLTPVISWQDTRGAQILESLQLCPDDIRARTGLFPNTHFGASKMVWCLRHVPEVIKAQQQEQLCIGPISTFLLHHLAVEKPFLVDASNAQRTLLYNIAEQRWDSELLNHFGVPEALLPEIDRCQNRCGHLALSSSAGSQKTVPVKIVSGDQNTAFIALGQGRADNAIINAGTGAFIGMPIATPATVPARLLQTVLPDSRHIVEGTVNGAGRALAAMARQFGCDINAIAIPAEHDVLFLNGEGGLAAPYWRAGFVSRFIGQGTALQKLAAVQESIVFLLYSSFLEAGALADNIQQLTVAGGLSQSEQFCQSIANLFQKPVLRPEVTEATALGAAILLAGNPQWPVKSRCFEPQFDAVVQQRFQRWRAELHTALNGWR